MFIIKAKCAVCEESHDVRNKHCRTRQQKMKKTKSTKIDDISFFSVKQTSIRFVVLFCSQSLEIHFSLNSVKRDEYLASQNDSQNDSQEKISRLESTSSESISESTSSESISESTSSRSALYSFVVVFVVVLVVAFDFAVLFIITFVDVFIQHLMISFLISSTHLNWQTIMMQMKKQSRQIIILFNVVSQLASITKSKRKLIVMFSNEDSIITNFQRISSKRVVKLTKRAQTIRIETIRVKRAKIHEESIELLISLNFETTRLEQKNALFVNKHVSSQSNHHDRDSFTNVVSITNLSISNQSFSESLIVVAVDITHDSASVSVSALISIFEIESDSAHLWLSRNVFLIDNHSIAVIIFNISDTSLSSSFFDSISSFFSENLLSQITTITLQKFFERARREARQQVRNVYSYDLVINQIIKSFYSVSTKVSSHLLLYLSQTTSIQTLTSTTREIKQRRDVDRSRDRLRESDIEREILRWISFRFSRFLSRLISKRQASAENCQFCSTMCTSSRT